MELYSLLLSKLSHRHFDVDIRFSVVTLESAGDREFFHSVNIVTLVHERLF